MIDPNTKWEDVQYYVQSLIAQSLVEASKIGLEDDEFRNYLYAYLELFDVLISNKDKKIVEDL